MDQLAAASGPAGLTADLSRVLEDHATPLGARFAELVGRICTAVANATAMSLGIDVAALSNRQGAASSSVLDAMPEAPREAVMAQQRGLAKRLAAHWNNPLCSELEFALQKRVSKEECRHLAFFPDDRQIESYVMLVQDPPDGAPKEHPQRKIRSMFLSLLYLVHIEDWGLMRRFVAAGGILALSDHINADNEGVRTQAIDVIHRLTSSPYFDWFEKPKDHQGKQLHQAFLRLSQSSFVKNLLGNVPGGRVSSVASAILGAGEGGGDEEKRKEGDGGRPAALAATSPSLCSFYSLQILAFWLSWVRKLYTQKGELRLSHEILGTLQQWSQVDTSMVTSPDEIELARKVYEDFSRFPAADDVEGHHVAVQDGRNPGASDASVTSAPTAPGTSSFSSVVAMRPPREAEFHPAGKFQGPREGYVFKSGNQGMGYYTDFSVQERAQMPQQKRDGETAATKTQSETTVKPTLESSKSKSTRPLSRSHISPAARRTIEARNASLRADTEKTAGNVAFGTGDFDEAVARYTAAIGHDATRSVLYANRAAAYLEISKKIGQDHTELISSEGKLDGELDDDDVAFGGPATNLDAQRAARMCSQDCDAALRLHPTYIKAMFRRAQANLLLAAFDDALRDVEKSVVLARKELQGKPPKKRTAELKKSLRRMRDWKLRAQNKRDAHRRVERGWSTSTSKLSAVSTSSFSSGPTAPATEDLLKTSKLGSGILGALLKRTAGTGTSVGGDNANAVPNKLEPASTDPDPNGGSGLLSQSGQGAAPQSESALVAAMDATMDASTNGVDTDVDAAARQRRNDAAAKKRLARKESRAVAAAAAAKSGKIGKGKNQSAASAINAIIAATGKKNKKSTNTTSSKKGKKTKVEGKVCAVAGVSDQVSPPRTVVAVENVVCKALKYDPSGESLVPYFSVAFPPANFRRVFKEQINEAVLVAIVKVAVHLAKLPDHEALLVLLSGLSRVKRLETAVMFLCDEDMAALKGVLEDVVGETASVEKVRAKFKCLR